MFQLIDISARILYDKQKEENKLVGLINASLSHEVRNPLNSIIAQNFDKKRLYEDLKKTVDFHPSVKEKTADIIHQLNQGMKVQESSCKLMMFMAQSHLDYAQIKEGKLCIYL